MFDIGFFEILLICLVALLVLGPDRLPHAARMTGSFLGKLKRLYIDAKLKITEQVELQELQQRLEQIEKQQMNELPKIKTQDKTQNDNQGGANPLKHSENCKKANKQEETLTD